MRFIVLFVIGLGPSFLSASQADTINIPADYPTVQQGIDAASNGDTVLVASGTYFESINFLGKAIHVRSQEGAASTIIHADAYERVVGFTNGEGLDSILEGFTLRNGDGENVAGPGIWCYYSSPTIRKNILTKNVPDSIAGIIECNHGSPVIEYNAIHHNDVGSNQGVTGILCNGGSPTITNNEIYYNPGIGIYCTESEALIANNNIYGNYGWTYSGGGIWCMNCSPVIVNNYIRVNSDGGGILCSYNASPTITNNKIIGNAGIYGAGGIVCDDNSNPVLTNNTIMHNTGVDCPVGGIYCQPDCVPVITNSIIWGNSPGKCVYGEPQIYGNPIITYSDVEGGWPGIGNIDSDPLVVHLSWDAHITYNSPCRGSGDNSAVTELFDIEGDPRIAYGTVDMGADEFYTHLYITGDQTPGGDIQGKFVGLPGTSPVRLFIGLGGVRPTPLPTIYGDLWLLPPRLSIPLVPIPANGILAVPTTIPLTPPAPYDIPMQALIGLNSDSLTNLCVLEVR